MDLFYSYLESLLLDQNFRRERLRMFLGLVGLSLDLEEDD